MTLPTRDQTQYITARAPNGSEIVATCETIPGKAGVYWFVGDDGKPVFDYDGNGTEVFWDDAETDKDVNAETLFYDDDGKVWPESKITFDPVEEGS